LTALGEEFASSALELARSLWAELGVGDAPRRHDWQALDLEPLIIFTAACAAADARLRSRTIDWCIANSGYVSGVRLHHFWRLADKSTRRAVEEYVATIESATRQASSPEARASPRPRRRPRVRPDLRRPSLVQLRLRGVVGVSVRAEIMKLLLADPARPRTASSLATSAGYGKSALMRGLDMLTTAGITTVERAGSLLVYRLSRPAALGHLLEALPAAFPDWWAAFKVIDGIGRYARVADREPAHRVAAATRLLQEVRSELQRVPAGSLPPRVTDAGTIGEFEDWARAFVAEQARAGGTAGPAREVVYTVHRLLLGGWIATVSEAGDHPRPLALSGSPELRPDRRARRRMPEDEVGAAADVIESMLLDMRTRGLQRSQGSVVLRESVADSLIPALSREFASELLEPIHKGQSAAFTEEFLQRWFTDRRRRLSETG
jgi:DNA-binding transcriptional ArsR family regulator